MMRSLRRQRGFIYLTTGANGAGKTLLTLKDVREKQVKEGRSVYYCGFDMKPEKAQEFGWQKCDPKAWQDLPDGSIVIMDECQDYFPVRPNGSKVPDYVEKLAVHRKRGFDFFLITQHPANIDKFVVRLIGDPGWHRHLKRTFGAQLTSVIKWSAVNNQCEKPSSGKTGQVSSVPYPKEVYDWYNSATIHTAKRTIPKQVYVIAASALLIPLLGYFAWSTFKSGMLKGKPEAAELAVAGDVIGADVARPVRSTTVVSQAQYFESYHPRVPGLPHTAPRYDDVTKPITAPYPAACLTVGDQCRCYTQQATRMQIEDDTCRAIAEHGFFVDWQQAQQGQQQAQQKLPAQQPSPIPTPPLQTRYEPPMVQHAPVRAVPASPEMLAWAAARDR